VSREQERRAALEALDRILNRGGDADDVLRAALQVLSRLYPYVGIRFVEDDGLVQGPSVGERAEALSELPVVFEGIEVARLDAAASGAQDGQFLERVARLVAPYCLVGWDTGGEVWEP
jgi:hypothetical protein